MITSRSPVSVLSRSAGLTTGLVEGLPVVYIATTKLAMKKAEGTRCRLIVMSYSFMKFIH